MSIRKSRREAVIDRLADHILKAGLSGSSLKALAAAVGASDRMLLYYFRNKDDLLTAALGRIAERLTHSLDAAAPPQPVPFQTLLATLAAAVGDPALKPYMEVWLELVAASARGVEPHRTISGAIADGFIAWAAEHLEGEDANTRRAEAALFVATLDGLMLLDAAGRGDAAARAVAVIHNPRGL
jgi:AcrR family transcriptional regulator